MLHLDGQYYCNCSCAYFLLFVLSSLVLVSATIYNSNCFVIIFSYYHCIILTVMIVTILSHDGDGNHRFCFPTSTD